MKKNKIKILMQPSDFQGVGYWRTIWPAQSIEKHFKEDFDVEIGVDIDFNNIDYLSKFDIIHFHRQLGNYENFPELSKKLKEKGVILIMDIDDFWEPPTTHPLYELVKKEGLSQKISNNLKYVDYVTTTTEIFKKYIEKINKNVEVIPNAIDLTQEMWKTETQENKTDKCRVSWIGGSSHYHDLLLLKDSMIKLNHSQELKDKFQIIMCGYDIRGAITEIRPDGTSNTRKILPQESVWNAFEEIFTSNYSLIENKKYVDYLKSIKKEDFNNFEKENYIRRWTLPLTQYGKHYDFCDVCLAPLQETEMINKNGTISNRVNIFNEVKSELKVIEAGMKKKALIAQDFGIYKKILKNGENAILVSENKKGWYKAIKELVLNKDLRENLAKNLYDFVKEKYELKNVTEKRTIFYKSIIAQKTQK